MRMAAQAVRVTCTRYLCSRSAILLSSSRGKAWILAVLFLPLPSARLGFFRFVFHLLLQGLVVFPGVANIPPQAPLHAAENSASWASAWARAPWQGGGYGFLQAQREMGRGMAGLEILHGKFLRLSSSSGSKPRWPRGPPSAPAFLPFIAQGHKMSAQQQVRRAGLSPVDHANLPVLEAKVLLHEFFEAFLLK